MSNTLHIMDVGRYVEDGYLGGRRMPRVVNAILAEAAEPSGQMDGEIEAVYSEESRRVFASFLPYETNQPADINFAEEDEYFYDLQAVDDIEEDSKDVVDLGVVVSAVPDISGPIPLSDEDLDVNHFHLIERGSHNLRSSLRHAPSVDLLIRMTGQSQQSFDGLSSAQADWASNLDRPVY